ncbi:copper resistance protein NlpE N-terminal domain-containing protein [Gemmatimonadota bacterium DH-20]|uniref:Copper resistance protein NlpE N-terminal domain-containing protein n=1 Tax=Gaopeijia maritima TaxID=3119007 RepID=A0ABU9EAX3_9BACT
MAPHSSSCTPISGRARRTARAPFTARARRTSASAVPRSALLRLVAGFALAAALTACGSDAPGDTAPADESGAAEAPETPRSSDVPMVAVDDPTGVNAPAGFRALLPCADCPGIVTTLALEPDGSGTLTRRYLEGEPGRDPAFEEEGRWVADGPRTIAWTPADGGEGDRFLVFEGDLVLLARDGSEPTNRSPRLTRLPLGPMMELAATSWRFVDPEPAGGDAAVPSVRFGADGTLTGTDGCNAFRSNWSAPDEQALAIDALAGTRMACPPGAGVVALRATEALEAARGYRLENDGEALVLLDGAGEPIARLRPTL